MQIATTIRNSKFYAYCQGFIEFFQSPGTGRTHPTAPKAYDRGRNLADLITGGW
jgi:hypothetical protein